MYAAGFCLSRNLRLDIATRSLQNGYAELIRVHHSLRICYIERERYQGGVMSLIKNTSFLAICALLASLSSTGATQGGDGIIDRSEPARVDLVYAVYAGGFHVLDAHAYHVRQSGRYDIGAGARTEGFLDWLFSWEGRATSIGRLNGPTVVPDRHENWGHYNGSDRRVLVTYDQDGTVSLVERNPEPDWEELHPLPEDAPVGTIDPLSLVAQVAAQIDTGGSCEGTFPVFDGKRRYNLIADDKGIEELPENGYSIFHGPALKCRLDYEMLGGNRKEISDVAKSARNRDIWVAQVFDDGPSIPVRLRIETSFGVIFGHLTEARFGDRKISLDTGS